MLNKLCRVAFFVLGIWFAGHIAVLSYELLTVLFMVVADTTAYIYDIALITIYGLVFFATGIFYAFAKFNKFVYAVFIYIFLAYAFEYYGDTGMLNDHTFQLAVLLFAFMQLWRSNYINPEKSRLESLKSRIADGKAAIRNRKK